MFLKVVGVKLCAIYVSTSIQFWLWFNKIIKYGRQYDVNATLNTSNRKQPVYTLYSFNNRKDEEK